ncbi:hypothetical protein EV363DRAFT_1569923 [Boletus edulis]|nr:hypothetical protein EV363DRAFT_1569923 [Boletus edulis]
MRWISWNSGKWLRIICTFLHHDTIQAFRPFAASGSVLDLFNACITSAASLEVNKSRTDAALESGEGNRLLSMYIPSEPDLDPPLDLALLPLALNNPRPPPPEPARRSTRQPKKSATTSSNSNTRKRNSDHLDPSESWSKRPKPTYRKEHPAIVQAGYYAAEMFTTHTARLHVIGLIVIDAMIGDVLYFWRTFPVSWSCFSQCNASKIKHWGLNLGIDPNFGLRPKSHKTILSDKKGEKIDVTLELSDEERVTRYGLNDRATNLFSVKSEKFFNEDDLVVKVFWAEVARTSEPDILQRVYDIGKDDALINGHVPDMLWYREFEDTSTANIRERLGLKTQGARVLYTIIFRKLRPITELSERDFLHACSFTLFDQGHLALWKKQVYHRDISPSNLMYQGKIVGVLNDFDLASIQETATGTERTGTVPFMVSALLREEALQGDVRHACQHDAESFIWVLIWISLRYDDGKPLRKVDQEHETKKNEDCRADEGDVVSPEDEETFGMKKVEATNRNQIKTLGPHQLERVNK